MPPIWNPRLVLGLQPDEQREWQCVGTVSTSSTNNSQRCPHYISHAELHKIQKLVADMSNQMPDQVEHNVLLHLARACLCVNVPEPHRGNQEAAVIYRWTELMAKEAEALRVYDRDEVKIDTITSPLDRLPTPKAFISFPCGEGNHWNPVSTPVSVVLAPPSTTTCSTTIRDRRASRTASNDSSTSPLTIIPPQTFAPSSISSLPPSPPSSATYTLPFPSALTTSAEALPPLPTATTINTNGSSNSTPRLTFTDTSSPASPARHSNSTTSLGSPALRQLEEYTRLLGEIQARQAAVLQQTADLRVYLSFQGPILPKNSSTRDVTPGSISHSSVAFWQPVFQIYSLATTRLSLLLLHRQPRFWNLFGKHVLSLKNRLLKGTCSLIGLAGQLGLYFVGIFVSRFRRS